MKYNLYVRQGAEISWMYMGQFASYSAALAAARGLSARNEDIFIAQQ